MRSRRSSKNSAKTALKLFLVAVLIAGCSPSIIPNYPKEYVEKSIQDIAKKEYQISCRAKITGQTLWVYLPVEDIFIPSEKPEKSLERFAVDYSKADYHKEGAQEGTLSLEYLVRPVPEKKTPNPPYQYNKAVSKKISDISKVALQVLHDSGYSRSEKIQFFCLVVADIKNGFEIKEMMYYPDLKKLYYFIMDSYEYQHRVIQDSNVAPQQIIGDKEGLHLAWEEIDMRDFIMKQIEQRVRLKFKKPEVERESDIDREIVKTAIHTIKAYNFKDFTRLEFDNLFSNKKIILRREEVWANRL